MLARQTGLGFEAIVLKQGQIEEKVMELSSISVTQGKGYVFLILKNVLSKVYGVSSSYTENRKHLAEALLP